MSVATRSQRLLPSSSSSELSTSFPSSQVAFPAVHHEAEAPEQGAQSREAPEWRSERSAEAPDAGEGRAALLEHEFTHGRSQS